MRRAAVMLILLWYAASFLLDRPYLPLPHEVAVRCLQQVLSGDLLLHSVVSLGRILTALIAAFIPACVLGIAAGRVKSFDAVFSPFVYLLYPIPKIAFLPIILLFFGLGNLSKIILIMIIIFFQLFIVIRDAVAAIDPAYFDSFLTLSRRRGDMLRHVVLPAAAPKIFTAIRIALGTSFAVLFIAETFATTEGLGWFIMDSWARLDYVGLYAGITALSAVGTLLFLLCDQAAKRVSPWSP